MSLEYRSPIKMECDVTPTEIMVPLPISDISNSTNMLALHRSPDTPEKDPLAIDSPVEKPIIPTPTHSHSLRRNLRTTTQQQHHLSSTSTAAQKAATQASTMREVLASVPDFSAKPRRRSKQKMSTAAQIEQTKDGKIDLETPDSILVQTNLRALLNKQTFSMLPSTFQYKLIQLLPSVDRPMVEPNADATINPIRLNSSSLNNEFFARACLEWSQRLGEGEFTSENQAKIKSEADKERSKLDPWKMKHFEPLWGDKSGKGTSSTEEKPVEKTVALSSSSSSIVTKISVSAPPPSSTSTTQHTTDRPTLKTTIKLTSSASATIVTTTVTTSGNHGSGDNANTSASALDDDDDEDDDEDDEEEDDDDEEEDDGRTENSNYSESTSDKITSEIESQNCDQEDEDEEMDNAPVILPTTTAKTKDECDSGIEEVIKDVETETVDHAIGQRGQKRSSTSPSCSGIKQYKMDVEEPQTISNYADSVFESFTTNATIANESYLDSDLGNSVGAMMTCSDDATNSNSSESDAANSAEAIATESCSNPVENNLPGMEENGRKFDEVEKYGADISTDENSGDAIESSSKDFNVQDVYGTIVNASSNNFEMDSQHIVYNASCPSSSSSTSSSISMSSSNTVSVAGNSQSSTASLYDGVQHDWNYGIKQPEEEENMQLMEDRESNEDNIAGDDCSNYADDGGEIEDPEEGQDEYVEHDMEIPTTSAEMEVSSTVLSSNSNNSSDCNIETTSASDNHNGNNIVYTSMGNYIIHQQQHLNFPQQKYQLNKPLDYPNSTQHPFQMKTKRFVQMNTAPQFQQRALQQNTNNFLPVSTSNSVVPNNPSIKIVQSTGVPTTIAQQRSKMGTILGHQQSNKGRKSTNSKLPPGAVNLERSYQICQAVIQNSKNRQQLSAQLRPPSSMVPKSNLNGSNVMTPSSSLSIKSESNSSIDIINSSNIGKTYYKILSPNFTRKKYVHRQPSPTTMIRHMYPAAQEQPQQSAQQFVLVHRANQLNQAPRASSAPPTQNQV
ncbi:ASXL2 family protein [Megaselia abdita]